MTTNTLRTSTGAYAALRGVLQKRNPDLADWFDEACVCEVGTSGKKVDIDLNGRPTEKLAALTVALTNHGIKRRTGGFINKVIQAAAELVNPDLEFSGAPPKSKKKKKAPPAPQVPTSLPAPAPLPKGDPEVDAMMAAAESILGATIVFAPDSPVLEPEEASSVSADLFDVFSSPTEEKKAQETPEPVVCHLDGTMCSTPDMVCEEAGCDPTPESAPTPAPEPIPAPKPKPRFKHWKEAFGVLVEEMRKED